MSASRNVRALSAATCKTCGTEFPQFVKTQLFCSRVCSSDTGESELEKKAKTISSNIPFGEGKKDFFQKLIREALHKPCVYCRTPMTLETMSVDHKNPVLGKENRASKEFNTKDNLHIVCRDCNTMKGDMSHGEYLILLSFFELNPAIAVKVRRRLGRSNILWGFKKH